MPRSNPKVLSIPIAGLRTLGVFLDIVLLALAIVAHTQGEGNVITYIAFSFSFLTNLFDVTSFTSRKIIPCNPAGGDMFVCDLITLGALIGDAIVWTWHFCIYETSEDICDPVVAARAAFGITVALCGIHFAMLFLDVISHVMAERRNHNGD